MTAVALTSTPNMKAVRHVRYGPPGDLQVVTVDVPSVADDRVLVRVRASSVNAGDWHLMRGEPLLVRASEGLRRPRSAQLGSDVAGTVEQVGKDVTEFRPGDRVFGTAAGAFAEYAAARPVRLLTIPEGFSFEEAAAVPVAGTTALQAVRDHAAVAPGSSVLIAGAGGGVGTFAVQIAKSLGAAVTASSRSSNAEMLRSIGADEVLDSAVSDFTRENGRWDAIVDVAGTRPLGAALKALKPGGRYVMVGGPGGRWIRPMDRMIDAFVRRRLRHQQVTTFLAHLNPEDLLALRALMTSGSLRPAIARSFALTEVPDAIRYVEELRASGKVVITI